MAGINDGRWGWDGIRTISLHCEIHILWEIPRGPSDLGVESEWGPPSPIHQPTMGASISAIDHPLADWITEGQLPGLLRPQSSSTHRPRMQLKAGGRCEWIGHQSTQPMFLPVHSESLLS